MGAVFSIGPGIEKVFILGLLGERHVGSSWSSREDRHRNGWYWSRVVTSTALVIYD